MELQKLIEQVTELFSQGYTKQEIAAKLMVNEALSPKTFVVGKNGSSSSASIRPFGLARGKIVISDDFDAPLSDEVLELFGEHETAH